jgi:hypothetical protein
MTSTATMPFALAAAWIEPHGAGILTLRIPGERSSSHVTRKA